MNSFSDPYPTDLDGVRKEIDYWITRQGEGAPGSIHEVNVENRLAHLRNLEVRFKESVSDDDRFARMAIDEARRSISEDGRVRPRVGAVVIKDGTVIAVAHRGESPECHAEYVAMELKLKEESLVGATIYTTLEPCTTRNHPKVPCAVRITERGVARVVMGMLDPNPDIRGKGDQLLNDAGIETQLFPRELRAQVEEMNRDFSRVHRQSVGKTIAQPSAETIAARNLYNAAQNIEKSGWALFSFQTQYGVVRSAQQKESERREIFRKIDRAQQVFDEDFDLPRELAEIAKQELGNIIIALNHLQGARNEVEMRIFATQIQDACNRIRVAAKPYAYRP